MKSQVIIDASAPDWRAPLSDSEQRVALLAFIERAEKRLAQTSDPSQARERARRLAHARAELAALNTDSQDSSK